MPQQTAKNAINQFPTNPVPDETLPFILTFSLLKDFNAVLDAVQREGLAGLESPSLQKHLKELDSFLPAMSSISVLLFSYFYVHQIGENVFSALEVEAALSVQELYLRYEADWQRLIQLGLLVPTADGKFRMPQKVIDAVSMIDLEYYFPQDRHPQIAAEHKKELFWRLAHYKDFNPLWKELFMRGEICK